MTDTDRTEKETLAAEHALRLIEGEDALRARGMMASDAEFAAMVEAWEDRLAPLHDAIEPVEPGPELWQRIEAALGDKADSASTNVVDLRKTVRVWQWATAGAVAAAIALAVFVVPPAEIAPLPETQAPLMANIPIAETDLRLAVTYLPDRSEMLVSASGLTADGVHDHELWVVDKAGEAQSLGVIVPGEERAVPIAADLQVAMDDGAQLVLTREPLGGAPAGGSAGPVVAEGQFKKI